MNYDEERAIVTELPQIDKLPDLTAFADNGLGVAAFDGEKMLGFLCCHNPWNNAFNSAARGTFSPIHAHGAAKENRGMIYKRLYQSAAEKWVKKKIAYHSIALYAHDSESIEAMFSYGFGLRCVDAVRAMKPIASISPKHDKNIAFCETAESDIGKIRDMRIMLAEHLGASPSFMSLPQDILNKWLDRKEKNNSRIFAATNNGKYIAFIEVTDSGENFATEASNMLNICGAFCLPEFRGTEVFQDLLNHAIISLKAEGYTKLGVDFEGFNPTASGFWLKYFTAYTKGVVRRIDECAII